MNRPYITNNFKDLSDYEGRQVILVRWLWNFEEVHFPPDRVIFLKDYPRTVMIDLIYGSNHIRKMVTKAAMAIKDVIIKDKATGVRLTGETVTEIKKNEEELSIWNALMML